MLDKQEMLMKLASFDKSARVAANAVLAYKEASLQKKAGPVADVASTIGYGLIPKIGPVVNAVGGGMGVADTAPTEKKEEEWDENPEMSLLPGVGAYRMQRRMKRQLVNDEGDAPHFISQRFGTGTSLLLAALAGAGLGGGATALGEAAKGSFSATSPWWQRMQARENIGNGASIGALGGGALALLAMLTGAGAAAVTKRRTQEEQKAYANSGTAKEWLIPGVGTYNQWKTIGRSIGDSNERKKKKKESEAEKETKTASVEKQALAIGDIGRILKGMKPAMGKLTNAVKGTAKNVANSAKNTAKDIAKAKSISNASTDKLMYGPIRRKGMVRSRAAEAEKWKSLSEENRLYNLLHSGYFGNLDNPNNAHKKTIAELRDMIRAQEATSKRWADIDAWHSWLGNKATVGDFPSVADRYRRFAQHKLKKLDKAVKGTAGAGLFATGAGAGAVAASKSDKDTKKKKG